MRVKDVMTSLVHVARPDDPVERTATLLVDKRITAVPVLDTDGRLVGIVSAGDLLAHRTPGAPVIHPPWVAADREAGRRRIVAEVMTRDPVTFAPDTDVADATRILIRRRLRSAPVVAEGHLVGIVSRSDILRTVIRTDDVLRAEVQHRLDEYAGGRPRWTAVVGEGTVTVDGDFDDDAELAVVTVLARTVPGVDAVRLTAGAATD